MTNETESIEIESTENFGKELAKSVVLSLAATVGTLGGFIVVGSAVNFIKTCKAQKAQQETEEN